MSIFGKIFHCFAKLYYIFNKLLCFLHLRRNRKNSGSILPMHSSSKSLSHEIQLPVPSNDVELESWEIWGVDDKSNLSRNQMQHSNNGGTQYNHSSGYNKGSRKDSADAEPDVDYFQELQLEPEIKRTQKILVRKKEENLPSNRLAMVSDIPLTNDLGTLEDGDCSGWSEEAIEDVSMEAMRDKRRLERERKLVEHQQKKLERDAQRKNNRIVSNKLS